MALCMVVNGADGTSWHVGALRFGSFAGSWWQCNATKFCDAAIPDWAFQHQQEHGLSALWQHSSLIAMPVAIYSF